jgi:hypothetical protein
MSLCFDMNEARRAACLLPIPSRHADVAAKMAAKKCGKLALFRVKDFSKNSERNALSLSVKTVIGKFADTQLPLGIKTITVAIQINCWFISGSMISNV